MQNKRRAFWAIAMIWSLAVIIHFLPANFIHLGWRFIHGDQIVWRGQSLVLTAKKAIWRVAKEDQLQVTFQLEGAPSLYFHQASAPSESALDFVKHFCGAASCLEVEKFDAKMGSHATKCAKFTYIDPSDHDLTYVLCGVDDISVMAKYIGPRIYADLATKEMETLVAQMK